MKLNKPITLGLALGTITLSAMALAQSHSTTGGINPGAGGNEATPPSRAGRESTSSADKTQAEKGSRLPSSEESSASGDTSRTKGSTANSPDMSPKDVCKQLVSNLDRGVSGAQLDQWIVRDGGKTTKGLPVQAWLKKDIGTQASCESESVAGNHAVVTSKMGDQEKLLPFVKEGGLWKMDVLAYHALYRMEKRLPASDHK